MDIHIPCLQVRTQKLKFIQNFSSHYMKPHKNTKGKTKYPQNTK
jgi:hypothetical protein